MARSSPLTVAIQTDPVETFDIEGDSTFALGLEAQARGHKLSYYLPQSLSLEAGTVTARVRPVTFRDEKNNHFTAGESERRDLSTFDVVLMRQDPPFDMSYITISHILDHIHPRTLVVNDPDSVRNAPEKILVMRFPQLMPPTLITADPADIRDFWAEHRDIIVKPLYGMGGHGIFRVRADDENLNSLIELYNQTFHEPMMVQAYLPAVRTGDKRIILVDGEAVGALNRVPAAGEARSNLHVGGRAEKAVLTPRDREICETIGPLLREQDLIFTGIDVIGDYLTEINVTSPTGLRQLERFDNINAAGLVWDAIERRLS